MEFVPTPEENNLNIVFESFIITLSTRRPHACGLRAFQFRDVRATTFPLCGGVWVRTLHEILYCTIRIAFFSDPRREGNSMSELIEDLFRAVLHIRSYNFSFHPSLWGRKTRMSIVL